MKHLLILISVFLLLIGTLRSQVGTWEQYPSATAIRQMVTSDQDLFMATDGGVLRFSLESESFINDEALAEISNLDVRTLKLDQYGRVWMGMAKPGQLIQVADLSVKQITSIGQLDLDEIFAFAAYGDSMFAAYRSGADGGVIYLRNQLNDIQYLDLYQNFPSTAKALNRIIGLEIIGENILLITEECLLRANLNANLKDPNIWTVMNPPLAGSDNHIKASLNFEGLLYFAQGSKIYSYDLNSFSEVSTNNSISSSITGLYPGQSGHLQITGNTKLYSLDLSTNQTQLIGSSYGTIYSSLTTSPETYWIGSSIGFLNKTVGNNLESFYPNMPLSKTFAQMQVWKDGILFGAGREGISMLYPFGWRVIMMANVTIQHPFSMTDPPTTRITDSLAFARNNTFEDIKMRPSDGHIFLSVQGRGVLEINPENLSETTRYDTTGGVIEIAAGYPNYMLPRQMAVDSHENVWVTVAFVSEGGQALTIFGADDTVRQIHQNNSKLMTRLPSSIAIDSYDRVWVGGQYRWGEGDVDSPGGLYLLDFHGNIGDESKHEWAQVLSSGSAGLAGIDINQLEIDESDYLWVRTSAGIQYMPVPTTFLSTTQLNAYVRANMSPVMWELSEYSIRQLEVDQRGNRWFLTDQDGLQILQNNGVWMNGGFGYTTGNSDIIDDQVYSACFDAKSGLAYISTAKGLAVMQTPFANPKPDYKTINIYPQPFRPDIQEKVYIQGLMDNSTVKILTINGSFVRELSSSTGEVQGYEAVWDGKDRDGDIVGTGVYLLFYFTEDGSSAVGKLAVVR